MGLKKNRVSAADALAKIDINAFQPIELTEGNVEVIFNRCLKTDKTVKELNIPTYIANGQPINPDGYVFDQNAVDANKKTILYLIGQTLPVHKYNFETSKTSEFDMTQMVLEYRNQTWIQSTDADKAKLSLLKLCHLARTIKSLSSIRIEDKNYKLAFLLKSYDKTLSPRDPNFPAWWEAHKAEWEG